MNATVTQDVQDQVLGIVRKSQEITLDAVKQVVETVNSVTGKLPAMSFAHRLPSVPQLPGAAALPTPETVVSSTFDFLDRLLAEQRKFARELVRATAELRPAVKAEPAAADSAPAAE
jgi:hypothetical protein